VLRRSSIAISTLTLISFLRATQDPAILQLHVVEGDGATYALGSRATRGITVQVTDETGRPVDGATVSFRLPEDGPSGAFSSGGKTEIMTTRSDGHASAWGMQWNRTAGLIEIRVTASKGQTRAGIVCSQYLSASADAGAKPRKVSGGGHKWLWIALGVAGAAGAAVVGAAVIGKSGGTPAPAAVQIGAPTIILGAHP
jgi:hypothetical protein